MEEKILTLEEFLEFCKKNNVIIDLDLSHISYEEYFYKTDEYAKIIINIFKKYKMFNSIIFNDGDNIMKLLKLKEIKADIAVSISNMNEKKNIEKIKDKFNDSKLIIYNMGNLLYGKTINKETVEYGLSLGKKIKAAKVNNKEFAEKLFSWGVNYITTQYLHPFELKNEREEPIIVKCNSFCEIDKNEILIDNEIYNIYYSESIFNLFMEFSEKPIGEFKYLNTNINYLLFIRKRYNKNLFLIYIFILLSKFTSHKKNYKNIF